MTSIIHLHKDRYCNVILLKHMDTTKFLNKGIRSLGSDCVIAYLNQFADAYGDVPIVSVGSGMGAIEFMATRLHDRWVCVDPDCTNYNATYGVFNWRDIEPFKNADYPNVHALIHNKPDIVGHCCVFLNWCDPNNSDYDIQAVELLKPIGILAIIERFGNTNGMAGGERFHRLYEISVSSNPKKLGYVLQQETGLTCFPGDPCVFDIRICWLHKIGCQLYVNFPNMPRFVESKIPHRSTFMSQLFPSVSDFDLSTVFSSKFCL